MKQAAIIGGGVVGLSTAIALQTRGFAVTVIDPDEGRRAASWGNAGHIATEQTAPLASWPMLRSAPGRMFAFGGALSLPPRDIGAWLPFALRMTRAAQRDRFAQAHSALRTLLGEAMPAWRRLADTIGAPTILRETGHYIVWETPRSAARGLATWRAADTGTAQFRAASPEEYAQLATLTRMPPAGAIHFEGTAQIADPIGLANALEAAFHSRGGTIRRARASRIGIEGNAATITIEGETLRPDLVVAAAGIGTRALLEPLRVNVPLIAERGYHIQTADHRWPDLPPVVFEDRAMIVTRFERGVRAASFVEFGRAESPPDPRKWCRLRSHVAALGLPIDRECSEWMGIRPTLPDYLPAIGRSNRACNLLYAFGHQHLGLTLAPITGELIATLAARDVPVVALAPFDIARFG